MAYPRQSSGHNHSAMPAESSQNAIASTSYAGQKSHLNAAAPVFQPQGLKRSVSSDAAAGPNYFASAYEPYQAESMTWSVSNRSEPPLGSRRSPNASPFNTPRRPSLSPTALMQPSFMSPGNSSYGSSQGALPSNPIVGSSFVPSSWDAKYSHSASGGLRRGGRGGPVIKPFKMNGHNSKPSVSLTPAALSSILASQKPKRKLTVKLPKEGVEAFGPSEDLEQESLAEQDKEPSQEQVAERVKERQRLRLLQQQWRVRQPMSDVDLTGVGPSVPIEGVASCQIYPDPDEYPKGLPDLIDIHLPVREAWEDVKETFQQEPLGKTISDSRHDNVERPAVKDETPELTYMNAVNDKQPRATLTERIPLTSASKSAKRLPLHEISTALLLPSSSSSSSTTTRHNQKNMSLDIPSAGIPFGPSALSALGLPTEEQEQGRASSDSEVAISPALGERPKRERVVSDHIYGHTTRAQAEKVESLLKELGRGFGYDIDAEAEKQEAQMLASPHGEEDVSAIAEDAGKIEDSSPREDGPEEGVMKSDLQEVKVIPKELTEISEEDASKEQQVADLVAVDDMPTDGIHDQAEEVPVAEPAGTMEIANQDPAAVEEDEDKQLDEPPAAEIAAMTGAVIEQHDEDLADADLIDAVAIAEQYTNASDEELNKQVEDVVVVKGIAIDGIEDGSKGQVTDGDSIDSVAMWKEHSNGLLDEEAKQGEINPEELAVQEETPKDEGLASDEHLRQAEEGLVATEPLDASDVATQIEEAKINDVSEVQQEEKVVELDSTALKGVEQQVEVDPPADNNLTDLVASSEEREPLLKDEDEDEGGEVHPVEEGAATSDTVIEQGKAEEQDDDADAEPQQQGNTTDELDIKDENSIVPEVTEEAVEGRSEIEEADRVSVDAEAVSDPEAHLSLNKEMVDEPIEKESVDETHAEEEAANDDGNVNGGEVPREVTDVVALRELESTSDVQEDRNEDGRLHGVEESVAEVTQEEETKEAAESVPQASEVEDSSINATDILESSEDKFNSAPVENEMLKEVPPPEVEEDREEGAEAADLSESLPTGELHAGAANDEDVRQPETEPPRPEEGAAVPPEEENSGVAVPVDTVEEQVGGEQQEAAVMPEEDNAAPVIEEDTKKADEIAVEQAEEDMAAAEPSTEALDLEDVAKQSEKELQGDSMAAAEDGGAEAGNHEQAAAIAEEVAAANTVQDQGDSEAPLGVVEEQVEGEEVAKGAEEPFEKPISPVIAEEQGEKEIANVDVADPGPVSEEIENPFLSDEERVVQSGGVVPEGETEATSGTVVPSQVLASADEVQESSLESATNDDAGEQRKTGDEVVEAVGIIAEPEENANPFLSDEEREEQILESLPTDFIEGQGESEEMQARERSGTGQTFASSSILAEDIERPVRRYSISPRGPLDCDPMVAEQGALDHDQVIVNDQHYHQPAGDYYPSAAPPTSQLHADAPVFQPRLPEPMDHTDLPAPGYQHRRLSAAAPAFTPSNFTFTAPDDAPRLPSVSHDEAEDPLEDLQGRQKRQRQRNGDELDDEEGSGMPATVAEGEGSVKSDAAEVHLPVLHRQAEDPSLVTVTQTQAPEENFPLQATAIPFYPAHDLSTSIGTSAESGTAIASQGQIMDRGAPSVDIHGSELISSSMRRSSSGKSWRGKRTPRGSLWQQGDAPAMSSRQNSSSSRFRELIQGSQIESSGVGSKDEDDDTISDVIDELGNRMDQVLEVWAERILDEVAILGQIQPAVRFDSTEKQSLIDMIAGEVQNIVGNHYRTLTASINEVSSQQNKLIETSSIGGDSTLTTTPRRALVLQKAVEGDQDFAVFQEELDTKMNQLQHQIQETFEAALPRAMAIVPQQDRGAADAAVLDEIVQRLEMISASQETSQTSRVDESMIDRLASTLVQQLHPLLQETPEKSFRQGKAELTEVLERILEDHLTRSQVKAQAHRQDDAQFYSELVKQVLADRMAQLEGSLEKLEEGSRIHTLSILADTILPRIDALGSDRPKADAITASISELLSPVLSTLANLEERASAVEQFTSKDVKDAVIEALQQDVSVTFRAAEQQGLLDRIVEIIREESRDKSGELNDVIALLKPLVQMQEESNNLAKSIVGRQNELDDALRQTPDVVNSKLDVFLSTSQEIQEAHRSIIDKLTGLDVSILTSHGEKDGNVRVREAELEQVRENLLQQVHQARQAESAVRVELMERQAELNAANTYTSTLKEQCSRLEARLDQAENDAREISANTEDLRQGEQRAVERYLSAERRIEEAEAETRQVQALLQATEERNVLLRSHVEQMAAEAADHREERARERESTAQAIAEALASRTEVEAALASERKQKEAKIEESRLAETAARIMIEGNAERAAKAEGQVMALEKRISEQDNKISNLQQITATQKQKAAQGTQKLAEADKRLKEMEEKERGFMLAHARLAEVEARLRDQDALELGLRSSQESESKLRHQLTLHQMRFLDLEREVLQMKETLVDRQLLDRANEQIIHDREEIASLRGQLAELQRRDEEPHKQRRSILSTIKKVGNAGRPSTATRSAPAWEESPDHGSSTWASIHAPNSSVGDIEPPQISLAEYEDSFESFAAGPFIRSHDSTSRTVEVNEDGWWS